MAHVSRLLGEAGATHRPPPPEPDTCCGRGCNGCVWEGFYAALVCWRDDAAALLSASTPPAHVQRLG
ncbi:oxidoreductase-like domain-containing protein [Hydrogenophaga defluvii]|uniref:Oxidoreductase-like domain-containing protein n=1 Tax=Hydrogenophaga defluvii TaxID=249410 RepID=A0ABW2S8G6_9BURK